MLISLATLEWRLGTRFPAPHSVKDADQWPIYRIMILFSPIVANE